MQYALLIYQNPKLLYGGRPSESDVAEFAKEYGEDAAALAEEYAEIGRTPGLTSTTPLGYPSDATTVRVQEGTTVTSAGTVGGRDATVNSIYLFEADDKDAAIEFASRIPAARIGGAVEIRPVETYY